MPICAQGEGEEGLPLRLAPENEHPGTLTTPLPGAQGAGHLEDVKGRSLKQAEDSIREGRVKQFAD